MLKFVELQPKELDKYVFKEHPEANFLQTSAWGKVYEIDGKQTFYRGVEKDGKLVASALIILKPAKRGRYLEIPGGPLIDWDKDKKTLKFFMGEIYKLAKGHNCVFVRMRPNVYETPERDKTAKELGLVKSPMHLHAEHTVMLDLTKTEDEILADMRRQTRYDVRRSAKLGIKVDFDNSKEAFDDFYDIQLKTAERQGFIPSPRKFIQAQREAFGENARIYTASLDGTVLAKGLILLQKPEAIYHEAASTDEGRKLPGAHALQWKIIQDAKAMGLKRYNLFGIAPPNSPHHRYAGVTTFKCGFGGEVVTFMPAYDLSVKKLHYKAVHTLEEIRKKRRHL
jgi:lipid II:glycine glycyltransferase (peptidoglycan interpeptide bridge formation enzyme)